MSISPGLRSTWPEVLTRLYNEGGEVQVLVGGSPAFLSAPRTPEYRLL